MNSTDGDPVRGRLWRRILGYGASRATVEGLFAGRGIVLASILGPEAFGVWALFRMGLRYCAFAGLGLLRGLELEVARAGHPSQRAHTQSQVRWGRIAVGHTLWLYGSLSAAAGLAWLWPDQKVASTAFLGVALGLLLDRLWSYGVTFLRASGGLKRFAVLELSQAALQFFCCVLLAFWWGIAGAFVGFAVANAFGLLMLTRHVPLVPVRAPREVRHLTSIGFPVSLMGILTATLATVDRLLVGAFLGLGALGTYAFAVSLSELGVSMALIVRTVFLRDVYRDKGVSPAVNPSEAGLDRHLVAFAILAPSVAGLAALALPPCLEIFMAEYRSAARAAQLLLYCGLAQGVINVAVLGVVAQGRQRTLPLIATAAVCLGAVLSLAALATGGGLEQVALAALVTWVIYAAAVVLLLARARQLPQSATVVAQALGPLAWSAAAVFVLGHLLPTGGFSTFVLSLLLYAVSLLPLLPFALRTLSKPLITRKPGRI